MSDVKIVDQVPGWTKAQIAHAIAEAEAGYSSGTGQRQPGPAARLLELTMHERKQIMAKIDRDCDISIEAQIDTLIADLRRAA